MTETNKKLGILSCIAISVGYVVASNCLVSLGIGMGMGGNNFIIAMWLCVILCSFVAFSYNDLNRLMPGLEGASSHYMLVGVGPVASIGGNVGAYAFGGILASSTELMICAMILQSVFFPNVEVRIIALIILATFFVINLLGVDIFAKTQNVMVYFLVCSMAAIGLVGILHLTDAQPVTPAADIDISLPLIGGLMLMAYWLFVGGEVLVSVGNQMKNQKYVLWAFIAGMAIIALVQTLMGSSFLTYLGPDVLLSVQMPQIELAFTLLGEFGTYWFGLVCLCAAGSTANGIYLTTSKFLFSMGEEGLLPKVFTKTNKRGARLTGLIILIVGDAILIISNVAVTSGIATVTSAACCFYLSNYILAHISVLKLRKKYPDRLPPTKTTWLGIPQIIGIIASVYMIINVASGAQRWWTLGIFAFVWIVLIIFGTYWVKKGMGIDPWKAVDVDEAEKFLEKTTTLKAN